MKDSALSVSISLSQWHWHLPMLLFCLLVAGAYLHWIFPQARPHEKKQVAWLLLGLLLCFLLISSPLEYLGRYYLFSLHMLSRLILIYLIAWMFILSLPLSVWQSWTYRSSLGAKFSRGLAQPLPMSLSFNLGFTLMHTPPLFDLFHASGPWFVFEFFLILVLAMMTWFPLLHPQVEARVTYGNQLFFIMTMILGQIPLFGILTLSGEALFSTYLQAPRIADITPYADQQMGGWLLKLFTVFVFGIMALLVIVRWSKTQQAQDQADNRLAVENFQLVQQAQPRKG